MYITVSTSFSKSNFPQLWRRPRRKNAAQCHNIDNIIRVTIVQSPTGELWCNAGNSRTLWCFPCTVLKLVKIFIVTSQLDKLVVIPSKLCMYTYTIYMYRFHNQPKHISQLLFYAAIVREVWELTVLLCEWFECPPADWQVPSSIPHPKTYLFLPLYSVSAEYHCCAVVRLWTRIRIWHKKPWRGVMTVDVNFLVVDQHFVLCYQQFLLNLDAWLFLAARQTDQR